MIQQHAHYKEIQIMDTRILEAQYMKKNIEQLRFTHATFSTTHTYILKMHILNTQTVNTNIKEVNSNAKFYIHLHLTAPYKNISMGL